MQGNSGIRVSGQLAHTRRLKIICSVWTLTGDQLLASAETEATKAQPQ